MQHGQHWDAIHESEEAVLAQIKRLVTDGKLPESQPPEVPGHPVYRCFLGPDGPLNGFVIIRLGEAENMVESAYPIMLDLAENELEVFSTEPMKEEDGQEIEGTVTAITKDGAEITFFCPEWLAMKSSLEAGGRFNFGLGGLAYSVEPAPKEIVMTEGSFYDREKKRLMDEDPNFDPLTFTSVSVQMGSLRTFFARDGGDFEFQSVIESVTPFVGMGTSGLILQVNLVPEDRHPIRVKLYCTAKVLNDYEPVAGDSVRGVAWLHGMPLERMEVEDSWLDSAEAAHGTGHDNILAMASFAFGNTQLPVAMQAVGGALVGAGWDLISIEDKLFRKWAPTFQAQRKGVDFWLFVRTAIKGFFEPEPFGADRERCETYAVEHGIRCLWVTVTLDPVGKHYAVSAEGLGEFADELPLLLELPKPEEFKVIKIGEPDDGLDSELDEAHAAEVFKECLNKADLNEFSKLLVEDLIYTSETAKIRIQGRQNFLSHLGTFLSNWVDEEKPVSARTGCIAHDGVSRPCAITISKEGRAVACTIFTVRRGHIAIVTTLMPPVVEAA